MTKAASDIARTATEQVAAIAAAASETSGQEASSSSSENEEGMLAFVVGKPGDTSGRVVRVPKPVPEEEGFALIRVLRAGVCNTDLEILKGYMGFRGILGHEFVGRVVDIQTQDDLIRQQFLNQRVCGDINVGCSECDVCDGCRDDCCSLMSRNHCPFRTVLGILNRNGTMAEYLTLPVSNLHLVPPHVSDEEAVFSEPLAAACRIVEQNLVRYAGKMPDRVAILGDGKLGLMIAEVVGREYLKAKANAGDNAESIPQPILFGKHAHKMDLVSTSGVATRHVSECQDESAFNGVAANHAARYDVVIDATGNPAGLQLSAGLCRPMGTLVLKSTCAAGEQFNAAPFVIDELRVVGSRCGPIHQALDLLALTEGGGDNSLPPLLVKKYITQAFPLAQAEEAIRCATLRETMKVQIVCSVED